MNPRASPREEVIRHEDAYYVLSTSSLADDRTRVLKNGETFAVFNRFGDFQRTGLGEQGLYHDGTRYLSHLELRLAGERPLLLSSTVRDDNDLLAVDLMNPALTLENDQRLPRGALHVFRSIVLADGACHERLRLTNHGMERVRMPVTVRFDADFVDIFEVRGRARERRGHLRPPVVDKDALTLAYEGLDGRTRTLHASATPAPASADAKGFTFHADLAPGEQSMLHVTYACARPPAKGAAKAYASAAERARESLREARARACRVRTSNAAFDEWIERSLADLHMLVTRTPHGPYPYAGTPWFSAPFGRDGLVTAFQTLWLDPEIARGVLAFLAATQAREQDETRDAEPGKIVHEMRGGEMAALGEVPFGRYYGSVDATLLFIMLAGRYFEHTGDDAFARKLWPHVERALDWVDAHADPDGDGFVEHDRRAPTGLRNQGWKDSGDAIWHADGRLAEGAIALSEVQGYAFAARKAAAALAAVLGERDRAGPLLAAAKRAQDRFDRAYWLDDLHTFAIALDGEKQPCRVRASNAGHALFAGIARPERAVDVARTLLDDASFTGFGVRTVAQGQARYNPMSYHNGSVWAHDTSLIADGLARYGLKRDAATLLEGLFAAARGVDMYRLPELFCGFPRRPSEGPTLYPVACAPQAWAAGAPFMMLGACLGLSVQGRERRLVLREPTLPPSLTWVRLERLRVGSNLVDVIVRRYDEDVAVSVNQREGKTEVVVVK